MANPERPTRNYDPFVHGPYPVGVRTILAPDTARGRLFPCEIWYPASAQHAGLDTAPATQDAFRLPGGDEVHRQMASRDAAVQSATCPLIIFSHPSGRWRRLSATFLCTHLASHGYVVAALDHSEAAVPELAPRQGETADQRAARMDAIINSRVPDVRFLLDFILNGQPLSPDLRVSPSQVGIVGHSFGGWTALAATEAEPRIRAAVALAPAGSSHPRPGILPVTLTFNWGHDVPTLYLAAENDVMIPLEGLYELYERTPATKQMVILRLADHEHFMDHVEEEHELLRGANFAGEIAWIPQEMRPMAELSSGDQAHLFTRGLTLAHMDAFLKQQEEAQSFLRDDLVAELASRGVEVLVHGK